VDLKPDTMFGEIAAIDRKQRSASIEALEPCTIASLSADDFEQLMVSEPSVAITTLHHVVAKVRRLSERVFEFSTLVVHIVRGLMRDAWALMRGNNVAQYVRQAT
jgi:CRP-like cAMP-binding protein